jgi:hypothetical protein
MAKVDGSRTRCPGSRYGNQEEENRTKETRTEDEGSRTRCPGSRYGKRRKAGLRDQDQGLREQNKVSRIKVWLPRGGQQD